MSLFDTGYYKLNKWGMIFCGSWPGLAKFHAWTIRIISIGSIITVMIPEYRYLYKVWGNYEAVIPCMPSQIYIIISLLKLNFLASNQKMVKSALNQITDDWKFLSEKSSDQVMHIHAIIARKRILLYFYILFISLIFFFGCSLLPGILDIIVPLNESREKAPPLETDYGVNFDDYFYLIIFHGALAGIAGASYIWTTDSFVMVMVQHCCALFETTRFAEFIEAAVTKMYAFVILVNMFMISITGVNAVLRLDKPNEVMKMAVFSIAAVIHLFFNTLPSQQLIDESSRLSNLIYDCNWTCLTIKSQKLILLMLVRSIRPCSLTAGKIYQMNMENFCQVIKTALSYLTILSSFH